MTVRVYYSSDVGAPTLSGSAGSLIALLDACLVTGYGSKQPAGWTKAFTGTNVAAYKFNTPGIGDYYVYIDDTGTGAANYARVTGYENMTSISDFTSNAMPLSSQISGGGYIYKSDTANTTARVWAIIATETCFYMYVDHASSSTALIHAGVSYKQINFIGRFPSFKAGDLYNVAIMCNYSSTAGATYSTYTNSGASIMNGHYVARTHLQTGQSVSMWKCADYGSTANSGNSSYGSSWPDPVTGGFILSPVTIWEYSPMTRRGRMPGCWALSHTTLAGYNCGDTFDGTGVLAGKTFQMFNGGAGSTAGRLAIEISNTW